MTEVSAALGISQLKRLDFFFQRRNKISNMYRELLDTNYLDNPYVIKNAKSSYHIYVIKLKKKFWYLHRKFFNYLRKNKINVNLHYIPVHLHPYYKSLGFKKGSFKNSENHAKTTISLPIYPNLSNSKIKYISKKH